MIVLSKKPDDSGKGKFLSRLIEAMAPLDVKFVHDPGKKHNLELGVVRFKFGTKAKKVLRLDGLYYNIKRAEHKKNNALIKKSFSVADGLVFQSHFCKEVTERYLGSIKQNHAVILNGFPIKDYDVIATKKTYQTFTIVAASRWRRFKRLKEITKAFIKWDKHNTKLLIAGKPDYKVNHPNISYLGYISNTELMTFFKIAHLYVHISWVDACPNSVIEAACAGIPIVCNNEGGTKEIVGAKDSILPLDAPYNWKNFEPDNPPAIDIDILVRKFEEYYKLWKLTNYENHSERSDLDINSVAKQYRKFFDEVLNV